jgi:alpha-N-arabinofuranosidase
MDASKTQDVSIDITGLQGRSVTGRILRSDKLQDHNSFDNPEKVKPATFNGANLSGSILTLKIPAFSVVVLELK